MRGDRGWEVDKHNYCKRVHDERGGRKMATEVGEGATIKLRASVPCSRMAMLLGGFTAVAS
jgi:hypothetical protein